MILVKETVSEGLQGMLTDRNKKKRALMEVVSVKEEVPHEIQLKHDYTLLDHQPGISTCHRLNL